MSGPGLLPEPSGGPTGPHHPIAFRGGSLGPTGPRSAGGLCPPPSPRPLPCGVFCGMVGRSVQAPVDLPSRT